MVMTGNRQSKTSVVSKSTLKAKMLGYFREVEQTGQELIVTDNRVPVLKIVPIKGKRSFDELFADVRGKMKYTEPLTTPTEEEWGALK